MDPLETITRPGAAVAGKLYAPTGSRQQHAATGTRGAAARERPSRVYLEPEPLTSNVCEAEL